VNKWLSQGMNDVDLSTFNHGGMNITGFRIVDAKNHTVRNFLSEWKKQDPKMVEGAGKNVISVRTNVVSDVSWQLSVFMSTEF